MGDAAEGFGGPVTGAGRDGFPKITSRRFELILSIDGCYVQYPHIAGWHRDNFW
jgi:hypothetical protein